MWREQMVFLCCQFGIWTVLIDCTCSVHCRMSHNTAALWCLLSDLLVLAVTDWCTFWLGLHVLAKYYSCSCCRKTAHSLSHKHKLACMTHTETRRVLPHIFATCTLCPCRSKQWQWNIHTSLHSVTKMHAAQCNWQLTNMLHILKVCKLLSDCGEIFAMSSVFVWYVSLPSKQKLFTFKTATQQCHHSTYRNGMLYEQQTARLL